MQCQTQKYEEFEMLAILKKKVDETYLQLKKKVSKNNENLLAVIHLQFLGS